MPYTNAPLTPEQLMHDQVLASIQALATEWRTAMANLDESLTTLAADIQTELQQVRDAVAAAQAAIGDKAALEQALTEAQGVIDSATSRVEQFSTDLKSDDPTPEPTP